jgi:hypothetical protein
VRNPHWGKRGLCLSAIVLVGSCKISQPSTNAPDACAIGELCGDAGSSEALSTMAETRVPESSSAAAATDAAVVPAGMCPGECLPDDRTAKECAEPVIIDLELAALVSVDGGALSSSLDASVVLPLDAGTLDASVPSASGISDASATEAGDLDGSSTLPGDAASRPLDVVDPTSGVKDSNGKAPLSCQLVSVKGSVTAGCAPSGPGVEGSVCTSARDCAAGFGCVGGVGAGQCLPYCCSGDDACGENRYCDLRPMRSLEFDDSTSAPRVPVCVAAEQCSLEVVTDGQPDARVDGPASCPNGSACTIVRANTTACRSTGMGEENDACPCGGGFFCSKVTNKCLKLCNTTDPNSCGNRECQPGPSGFPEGWGLCVGG